MDEEEVTDVEVEIITIEGKKYLIDRKTNIVYTYVEDLSKEQPEEVGELVDGELQEYEDEDELEVAWDNEEGFMGDYGGWTWTISVPPNALSESVIEEDEKGKPIEYEYSFPIIWSGLIRQKKKPYEIVDVKDYITEFPENNIVGNLIIYTKQLLVSIKETTDKIASKVEKGDTLQKGHSHLFKYNFKPETIIQELIDNDTITGKKRTPQEIEEKRRREAYQEERDREFELYKLKQEEERKANNPVYIQNEINSLDEEIDKESNPAIKKALTKTLVGLEKKLIEVNRKIKEDEERRAKIKADEEQRLKTLKEEKRLANKKIRDEEKQLKKQREEEQKKKREEEEAKQLNAKKEEDEIQQLEERKIQNNILYSNILEKGKRIDYKMSNLFNFTIFQELVHLIADLLKSLKEGVLIGNISFIEELVDLVNRLPDNKSITIPDDVRSFIVDKIIEIEPKVKELKPIVEEFLNSSENKVLKNMEVNARIRHPLYKALDSTKISIRDYIKKVEDIIKWKRETREEELKQIRKKYKRLFDEYEIAKKDDTIDKNKLKQMKDTLKSEYEKIQKLKSELETKGTGINNPELYEKAKQIADEKYKKPSAYKSGFIVKKYKELGGTYSGTKNDNEGIGRWFKEDWKDIGNKEYPVYRPTKRITKDTPLTPQQIKPSNLKKQIALKQEIKGDSNLPPFQGKGLDDYSNPKVVYQKARKYLGKDVIIQPSTNKDKKYMVYDPNTENWVHFGTMKPPMEDFTKHQDEKRRQRYLARATKIKGDWKDNKYSANNLSINLLW